jgi:hypothetical protein
MEAEMRWIERDMTAANARQMFQTYLDKSTPYTPYRWGGTATLFLLFGLRIFLSQGWYIGTSY